VQTITQAQYKVVCAYCGKVIAVKHSCNVETQNKISHGICCACKNAVLNELNNKQFKPRR